MKISGLRVQDHCQDPKIRKRITNVANVSEKYEGNKVEKNIASAKEAVFSKHTYR